MRKRLIIILLLLLLMLIPSCQSPMYQRPKYINQRTHKHKHKLIIKQDIYRNPTIKKEQRQKLLQPKTINLNDY